MALTIALFATAACAAMTLATLVEYAVHRLMHWGLLYGPGHRHHHSSNESRTFLSDLVDYGVPALLMCWPVLLLSIPAGLGWMFGVLFYAALAAYSHQLQHANPSLVFWMAHPVHRLHHDLDMGDRNFGVLVDWWDRLFHTYRSIEEHGPPQPRSWKMYLAIPWR